MPTYDKRITAFSAGYNELGQTNEIRQTIVVVRADQAKIDPDQEISAIVAEGHIPDINTKYVPSALSGMTWEQFALCRSVSYRQQGRGHLVFDVVWNTQYTMNPKSGATPTYFLPCSVEYYSKTRSTNFYRLGWTTNPSNTDATADIGGTAASAGIQPKSEQITQVGLRIRQVLDATVTDVTSAAIAMSALVNKKNNATFAGCAAGSLVCDGFSIHKSGNGFEFYEVVCEITFDPYFHLEQVPDTDEKGYPLLNSSGGAKTVKWKRTVRGAENFELLFGSPTPDANQRDLTLEGWWP